jgi:hypothetical protein
MTAPSSTTAPSIATGSSSAPQPTAAYYYPLTGISTAQHHNEDSWWRRPESLIAVMGMALTGVIGYFASAWTVKDSISQLTSQVSVLQEKVAHVSEKVVELKASTNGIPALEKEIAVIQTKLETQSKAIDGIHKK